MLLAALIIFALARPVLNPDRQSFAGEGPLLLVVDNGWASAAHWPERREAIEAAIERAGARRPHRRARADRARPADQRSARAAEQARERVGGTAAPSLTRRTARHSRRRSKSELGGKTELQRALALRRSRLWRGRRLRRDASPSLPARPAALPMLRPGRDDAALALGQASGESGELAARILSGGRGSARRHGQGADRPRRAARRGGVHHRTRQARDHRHISICRSKSAIRWRGSRSPASAPPAPCICSTGARNGSSVGIVSGESREAAQPLLSPLYYVQRALSPYADVVTPSEGNVANAIARTDRAARSRPSCLPISASSSPAPRKSSKPWVKSGGVLIRFAGPRLEQGGDELLPVALAPRRPLARRLALLEHAATACAFRGEEPVPRPHRA